MKIFNKISLVIGGVGGFCVTMLGGYDILLSSLITFVVIDYVSGVLKAICNKNLNSEIGFKGIVRKVMIFLVVAMSVSLSNVIEIDVRSYIIMFFLANEGISILENASEFLPIPKQLMQILDNIKNGDFNDRAS